MFMLVKGRGMTTNSKLRRLALCGAVAALGFVGLVGSAKADDAAREVIRDAGFGEWFTHRTGHNIEVSLHGNGAHLDNLETHDERLLLPNTCFSVEPGIYFPGEFGVRSEVNMITRPGSPERGGSAVVTGPLQRELLRI